MIMIYEQSGCHQETSLGLSVVLLLECVTKVTPDASLAAPSGFWPYYSSALFITTVSNYSKRLDLDLI